MTVAVLVLHLVGFIVAVLFTKSNNLWFLCLSALACFATQTYVEFAVAFGLHYLVFFDYALPLLRENLYDLTGMLSFITVTITSFVYSVPRPIARQRARRGAVADAALDAQDGALFVLGDVDVLPFLMTWTMSAQRRSVRCRSLW